MNILIYTDENYRENYFKSYNITTEHKKNCIRAVNNKYESGEI